MASARVVRLGRIGVSFDKNAQEISQISDKICYGHYKCTDSRILYICLSMASKYIVEIVCTEVYSVYFYKEED